MEACDPPPAVAARTKAAVFTGSRADYGPLFPVLRALAADAEIELSTIVSGSHLVPEQGLTLNAIQNDGFEATEVVEMVVASDTPVGAAKSFGLGLIGYADALRRVAPDVVVILGDRYEALAMAVACHLQLVPVAHIAGGEVTSGSTDDSVRHAISKLSYLHFTSTAAFKRRVIQLGEQPERVHLTGAPALDTIRQFHPLPRSEVLQRLKIPSGPEPLFTVTYHPATADLRGSQLGITGLLDALDQFPAAHVVFTGTNVDQGGGRIANAVSRFVENNLVRARWVPSLGQEMYLSLVSVSALVLGNSSSGIYEAPVLRTPTVNIGTRQNGRPRPPSVVDCSEDRDAIVAAVRTAMSPTHRALTAAGSELYGDGHAARRIVQILKSVDLSAGSSKVFYDWS